MLTEDYCSQEVVKPLKEKGFKIPQYYNSLINMWQDTKVTHQMAMKWLREVHDISIELLTMHRNCWGYYVCKILDNTNEGLHDKNYFNTYEEAIEAALKYSLENLI